MTPAMLALVLAGCFAVARPAPLMAQAPSAETRAFMLDGAPVQGGLVRGRASSAATGLALDGRAVAIATDGAFLLGFDRDAGPSAQLIERTAAGDIVHPLAVARRAWAIEHVDVPYRAGKTDAEFAAARPAELAAIVAARRLATDARGWRVPLRWPARGRISGLFGAQRVYQGKPGSYHAGVDIALPTGAPVVAPADGVVILAADHPFTLEGNLLMIDHGMGLNSAFLHLSRIDVRVGDHVRQGQPIGGVGMTGRATGPHLHWGLRWGEAKLDPLLVAGAMATR
jgi:murein DD-endopeptidase MepM/ murein hydrolase activator NlpD